MKVKSTRESNSITLTVIFLKELPSQTCVQNERPFSTWKIKYIKIKSWNRRVCSKMLGWFQFQFANPSHLWWLASGPGRDHQMPQLAWRRREHGPLSCMIRAGSGASSEQYHVLCPLCNNSGATLRWPGELGLETRVQPSKLSLETTLKKIQTKGNLKTKVFYAKDKNEFWECQAGSSTAGDAALRCLDWTVGHELFSLSVSGHRGMDWTVGCFHCQWAGTEVVRHAGWVPIFNCGAKRGTEPGIYFLQLIYLGTRFSFLDEHVWRICLSYCATLSPGIN